MYASVDQSGEIKRYLAASAPSDLIASVPTGETLVLDPAPGAPSWWDFDSETWNIKPPSPGASFIWDTQSKEWRDPRTLDDLKAAKWEEIRAAREAAKTAPLMDTPFGTFDTDKAGVENITWALQGLNAAAQIGAAPDTIRWTLADNSVIDLTRLQLDQVGLLLMQRGNTAHEKARALRDQINAATTREAVEAIVW